MLKFFIGLASGVVLASILMFYLNGINGQFVNKSINNSNNINSGKPAILAPGITLRYLMNSQVTNQDSSEAINSSNNKNVSKENNETIKKSPTNKDPVDNIPLNTNKDSTGQNINRQALGDIKSTTITKEAQQESANKDDLSENILDGINKRNAVANDVFIQLDGYTDLNQADAFRLKLLLNGVDAKLLKITQTEKSYTIIIGPIKDQAQKDFLNTAINKSLK